MLDIRLAYLITVNIRNRGTQFLFTAVGLFPMFFESHGCAYLVVFMNFDLELIITHLKNVNYEIQITTLN